MVSKLLFLLAGGLAVSAAPCEEPALRKEWREMSADEQGAYVKAVHCLASKPSRIGLNTTLYDDFPYIHNVLNNDIHFVANFLPWHRYFVVTYEAALRECGYEGAATYWDWTLDAEDPASSSIWDPVTGFGGNGQEVAMGDFVSRCIDGPFSDLRVAYRVPGYSPHCISRSFNNGTDKVGRMLGENYTPAIIEEIRALPGYDAFKKKLESGPHGAVHSGIAGDMMPAVSPNDPIFFLHHTQIDRIWTLWQQEDPEARNLDYGGNMNQDENSPEATLDDILPMEGVAEDRPVRDMMEVGNELLCYKY